MTQALCWARGCSVSEEPVVGSGEAEGKPGVEAFVSGVSSFTAVRVSVKAGTLCWPLGLQLPLWHL